MTENSTDLDTGSLRANLSRLGVRLSGGVLTALNIVSVMLIVGGVVAVISHVAIGWLLVGLAALPAMIAEWQRGELKHPKAVEGSIDGVLAGNILGKLSKNPTPHEVARLAAAARGGRFFAIRFGITESVLLNITTDQPTDMGPIWQNALAVREQTGSEFISGAVLVIAIMDSFSDRDKLMAHMKLEREDLLAGIRWYENLRTLIEQSRMPKRTGGIARDFAFGYIPLLKRFGQNLSMQSGIGIQLESHKDALDKLIDTFGSGGRQNASIVGASGVGKTTIVKAFAQRLLDAEAKVPDNLKFRQVFMLDSSALIAAAPGRGELEGLVMQVLGEAHNAKNIIICLDNAQLFFEEGVGSVDLTNVLLPILEGGALRVILTMDEQRLLQISQRNPALINALNRISIGPSSREETIAIMQDELIFYESQHKVTYMYQSLLEVYRLSERYVHDLEMPGRALKLLESAAGYDEGGLVTANSVQQAIEQTLGVKVGVASVDDEREKLLNLEDLIHKRMINQTRAVQVVSDALRRARAGVRNENRPIGTFLFLGPTGVGKTELSKALADVYFGGEDRMIRLDLNEYVQSTDVARLIADGADDPSSLTAQAMKQPFSVVLLDEIEKAHPQVLTTLLQLLDEGILRDVKNREVSFRDAIIVCTSNAGADRIREYIQRGYKLQDFEQKFIDELISDKQFKPEFLNRFDEIVVFRPLTQDELMQVIDLILAGVNKQMALQKISVAVADDAKKFLVEKGYDPRLGARPLRRVVQRAVENLVAKQMLGGSVEAGTEINITLEQVQAVLNDGTDKMSANKATTEGTEDPIPNATNEK